MRGQKTTRRDACATSGWHWRGYLPHLKAEHGTYFVTFRLADTLPTRVLESYERERSEILQHAKDQSRQLSPDEVRRLARLYAERIESYLDAGHGACWLRDPLVADIVSKALRHFDGDAMPCTRGL
jgi:hypothetical protein